MNGPRGAIFRAVSRRGRVEPLVLAVALVVLVHLPWGAWLGVAEPALAWRAQSERWLSGALIAGAAGVVGAMVFDPRRRLGAALAAWWQRAASGADRPWTTAAVAAAMAAGYAALGRLVFDGQPLLIDEVVQLLQARVFEEGRLWRPTDAVPQFRSQVLILDEGGKWFGQFPPAWPLLLAPFDAVRASWLAAPVLGGLGVAAFAAWQRATEPDPRVRWAAVLLFATSPFWAFLAASHMNHVPLVTCVLAGAACTARAVAGGVPAPRWAAAAGAVFGVALAIRPVDALAWGVPAFVWVVVASWGTARRWTLPGAMLVGGAGPALAFLGYNAATTGSPFLLAYEKLYGASHRLGFHEAPWGPPHTPARGVTLVHVAFARLQTYGFEGLVPPVTAAAATLLLWRRFTASDRYLAVVTALTSGLYFAYWHDGFYLGPRFFLGVWPVLVTWVARLPLALAQQWPSQPRVAAAAAWGLAASALIGWPINLPYRFAQYGGGLLTMRWDADREAAAQGATGGLVFVKEPWGSRILANLWAAGVPRKEAEQLYRSVDVCRLDRALDAAVRRGLSGAALAAQLEPLRRDSSRLVAAVFGSDTTARVRPGVGYQPYCRRQIEDDAAGTTVLAPRLLARDGTTHVRSMGALDTLLLMAEPQRPAFVLRQGAAVGSRPLYTPLNRDSAWAAARGAGTGQSPDAPPTRPSSGADRD